jgi:uncharacterized membrane protein YdjX (TVP38/TMEM64 family)
MNAVAAPSIGGGAHRRHWGLVVLSAVAALLVVSDSLHRLASGMIAGFEPLVSLHPILAAVTYLLLTALSAMLSFFSSAVLVPVAVHVWGGWGTLLLHWAGSLLGGVGAYAIGRWLGRPVARALVGEDRVAYWGARIGAGASFGVVLLLQLALQSEIPGYVLGTLQYRFRVFAGALALGTLPYAIGAIYIGRFFLDRRPLLLMLVATLAIGLAAWSLRRLRRTLRSSGAAAGGDPAATRA